MTDLTIILCARNAAATIQRAIDSALAQGKFPIVVVDDWSEDGTGARAHQAGGGMVQVVRPTGHRSLGYARQTALDHVRTQWLMWIDADDEALSGRAVALLEDAHRSGSDMVFDDVELFDGCTGGKLRSLSVPEFLRQDASASRQFERNFIPSLGWGLMRTALARAVGYDPLAHGVEDFDFCLRAIRAGARFSFRRGVSYRQYAYPTSVSRDLYARRADLVRIYRKHDYADVQRTLALAGWAARIIDWALVAVAIFREEYEEALRNVDRLACDVSCDDLVLEPLGPCPVPEAWRVAFQRGTLLALLGRDAHAERALREALAIRVSAETCNNLGVVLRRGGSEPEAQYQFAEALRSFPALVDAKLNMADPAGQRLTRLPLRVLNSRSDY